MDSNARGLRRFLPQFLRNLHSRHWTRLNFKAGLFMFGFSIVNYTPTVTAQTLDSFVIVLWGYAAMIGAVVSSAGLILGAQPHDWARKYGVVSELIGLIALGLGPLIYWTTNTIIVITHATGWDQRLPLMWFCYAMVAIVVYLAVMLLPRFRHEVADMKVVKEHGRSRVGY